MRLNVFGLIFVIMIMIPNIAFALLNKFGFQNLFHNKIVKISEQIGRFGCIIFMVLIIPGCRFGFSSLEAFIIYLIANTVLTITYCIIWIICFKQNTFFRALALSILPSLIFIISGILSRYIPLLITSFIFSPCHIIISYKNAVLAKGGTKHEKKL